MNMHSLVNARESIGYMEKSGANLSQSLKRLSTGIKVDATDAGGLAVSSKMDSVITRTRTLSANVQNGMSFLDAQDAAQTKLGAIIARMSELRVRYDDPTINTSDGANLNREFKELQDDIMALAQKKFNGISLFSSGSDADSKLVLGANSANPANVRDITRNQFFNSILETQSSGGPKGGSTTRQINFGSFTDRTLNATGGTASVPGGVVKGLQGSAITSIFSPTGGRVADFKVNGLQGTTPDFTLSGTAGTGVGATEPVTTTGGGGSTPSVVWTQNFTATAGGTASFDKMSPVFDSNGDIFIGLNDDNSIRQVDAADGSIKRTYNLGNVPATSTPVKNMSRKVALADTSGDGSTDTLYAASGDGKQLFAFDTTGPNAGNVKAGWPVNLGNAADGYAITESPPFVHSNGNIFVMSNGDTAGFIPASGFLHGFRPDGSSIGGAFPLATNGQFPGGFAEGPESVPGANDGALILTGDGDHWSSHNVRAINPNNGTDILLVDHGTGGTEFGAVAGPPLVVGNSVIVNTDLVSGPIWNRKNGRVVAIDLTTQAQTTLYNSNGVMEGGPAAGKSEGTGHATATDAVFVATSNGLAATTLGGATLWSRGGFNARTCTPVYDSTNNLVWVTEDTTGDAIAFRTVSEGGNAAGTEKHRISPATGGGLPAAAGSKSSPAIDSSGNIYFGYDNGNLTRISAAGSPITLNDVSVGTGYTVAPAPTDITLTQKTGPAGAIGTLAVDTVTLDDGSLGGVAGSLRVTFTGAAAAAGATYEVTAPTSTITPPAAVSPRGSGYLTTETAPAARVIASGINEIIANPPAGINLSTGLVTLIDGNAAAPTGAGTITDSSGNGNDGNVAAGEAPTHETTDRRAGTGAYVFDGANDKINLGSLQNQIGSGATSGPKDELTISAWVYHENTGDHRIVCKSPDTNVANHIFSLGITNSDVLRMRIGTDTTNATEMDGGSIPLKEWTHVAMTYDGANVKSYINGKLESTHALTGNIKSSPSENVYIGNVNNTQNRHFDGKLDDIGIWNVALDANHIAEIAGPGNLTATTSIITTGADAGKLTVTPSPTSTLATTGPFMIEVDDGTVRAPADLTGIGNPLTPYTHGDTAPTVTLTDTSGAIIPGFTATATINDGISGGPPPPAAGTLNISFAGNPPDTNDVTVQITDGVGRLSNFSVPTSGFAPGETPAVTILDNTGTVVPVAPGAINTSVDGTGTLNGDLSGVRTSDLGNHTVQIAAGAVRAPAPLTVGNGYTPGDPAPTVTLTDASGALIPGFTATATINNGTSGGPPPPAAGTLNIAFTGAPPDTNDVTVQIDNGVGRLSDFSVPGSGYAPGETPTVTITGGSGSSGTATATVDGSGTLNVNLSGVRTNDLGNHTVQIANGTTLQTPADLTLGSNHDPSGPAPTVILSGADAGLTATGTVQPDGTVNVSFAGTPTTAGTLNVQVLGAGGSGSTAVSSKYLLDIDGDLWDYSVSEFESFTKLVSDARAQNGAEQNSLSTFWDLLSTNVNKLEQAAGRIKDADFAKEMTEVSKSQINTRSAAVMLGKQNRITSEALLTLQNLSNML